MRAHVYIYIYLHQHVSYTRSIALAKSLQKLGPPFASSHDPNNQSWVMATDLAPYALALTMAMTMTVTVVTVAPVAHVSCFAADLRHIQQVESPSRP